MKQFEDQGCLFINNPVYLKYKKRFKLAKLKREKYIKNIFINERIVEFPFVFQAFSSLGPRSNILDLGCTESALPFHLASMGYCVTGLDIRDVPYIFQNFQHVKGDICCLPFQGDMFSAVSCVSVLEHIGLGFYADPLSNQNADGKAINEIFRVLKPGGVFVLTVPFGVFSIGEQQRIYDKKTLDVLLKNFILEDIRYLKNVQPSDGVNNYWLQIKEREAETVKSNDRTECVCLIKARKKS